MYYSEEYNEYIGIIIFFSSCFNITNTNIIANKVFILQYMQYTNGTHL